MRTAQTIEQKKAESESGKRPKRKMHPNSLRNLVAPWTPETRPDVISPGRPPDRAGELCRRIIENNEEEIYRGLGAKAISGDAYAFSVIADRGYGKLKQGIIHTGSDGGPMEAQITVVFHSPDGNSDQSN